MTRRFYAILLVAALLVACGLAYAAGRLLPQPTEPQTRPPAAWTPPSPGPVSPEPTMGRVTAAATPAARQTETPVPPVPALATQPALPRSPTPSVPAQSVPTRPSDASPTPTAGLTPSATAPTSQYPYRLAREVGDSSGDCPGSYVLGRVTDGRGVPLPDVSLRLVDEFGNLEIRATKTVADDIGRYDFPLFGPPRRFYLTVIDARGQPLSATVEIAHGLGSSPDATCHWADWEQR